MLLGAPGLAFRVDRSLDCVDIVLISPPAVFVAVNCQLLLIHNILIFALKHVIPNFQSADTPTPAALLMVCLPIPNTVRTRP